MSFGFSVGDFIAVGNVIKDICSCLQDAGGAKAEYQGLLRELECLQQALQHLDKLQNGGTSSSANLDSIKYAALSCRRPLEQFLAKIRKYDKSLGVWGKDGVIKSTADKLRWGFGQKEEIRKLQSYLNIHIGTINILLAEHGLEKMDLASDQAAAQQLHIRERLENTREIINKVSSSLTMQFMVVQNTQNMLARLFEMISGEVRTSLESLGERVTRVFVSTQQTYAVMLEIKSSLAGPDTRWSFFQAPLSVEDALGYKFPVPSEYDFDLLDVVVQQKFKTGPGSLDVQAGNYEYFKTKNSTDVLSRTSRLLPGTAITMAIIVGHPTLTDETCPMPGCDSIQTTETPGGGRTCCTCNVWFSPTEKKRRSLHDLLLATSTLADSSANEDEPVDTGRANKRAKLAPAEEDVGMFRNVRLARDEPPDPPNPLDHDVPDPLDTSTLPNHESSNNARADKDSVTYDEALSYVNKVKDHFAGQESGEEAYKQFLEILQTYQRESKPIQDTYTQIVSLFDSAPDLVEGFKQFLPESVAAYAGVQAARTTSAGADKGGGRKRRRD